jgi:tetraacyldisaccharide 4'-kinase
MGGTGKTPTVISLAHQLQKKHKVAILSRGYGRKSKGTILVDESIKWELVGDEPALLATKLNGVPIVVDENRARGGKYIVEKFSPDIIVLDDAFQHRKIHRDVDIVLIDASEANQRQFLRESYCSLKRANLILITRGEESNISQIKNAFSKKYNAPIYGIKTILNDFLVDQQGESININDLRKKSVFIFSGVGNNKSFYKTVKQLGFQIVESMHFKDHHKYTENDLRSIELAYRKSNAGIVLTTEKDLIKLPRTKLPIFAVQIEMFLQLEIFNHITA